ncbi:UDP-N-acetylhexosamine pyrophosphorylase [Armadillidium nasatum]|uniref:UDP-N-acetylglucosamine diphosphorylase n=1 Tax=Armadillidium nasatum TaxID=96803 RepID=A0A5N5TCX1_9CRUS|nr:UDP-N-acetylhexosamine pyrophosphorylase [Armadillidium nasatum]
MDESTLISLRQHLKKYGQESLLDHFDSLSEADRKTFCGELNNINFEEVCHYFKRTVDGVNEDQDKKLDEQMEPIPSSMHGAVTRTKLSELQRYEDIGLREVSNGHVAVLLLAGGQGTRLGVNYPKGMYDVSLPSHKTLYQVQAERLLKLEHLAAKKFGKHGTIPWYIMTSEHTKEPTMDFFESHNFFGLDKNNLVLFEQGMLPCFDFDGKIILEAPGKIAKAPDGNGGLVQSFKDNILVKMADPIFMGYCITKQADCGAKVVEKAFPTEAVGVVCRVGGVHQVVEYSEITLKTAQKRNKDGRLTFSAGNICNHYFTTDFLKKFVFNLAVWEVIREDEFSPLKNADGAEKDTPSTCRYALFSLHHRYVLNAGGTLVDAEGEPLPLIPSQKELSWDECKVVVEISPLVSYAGEGLADLVSGKKFQCPLVLEKIQKDN